MTLAYLRADKQPAILPIDLDNVSDGVADDSAKRAGARLSNKNAAPVAVAAYSKAKMRFQSFFMSITTQWFVAAISSALSRRPKDVSRS